MSYTAVPTVSTGDVWTASNHNVYIRDNFRAVAPGNVTTKGQLAIGGGANALTLLGVGADGESLHGDAAWRKHSSSFVIFNSNESKDLSGGGSGNLHIPTDFGVPEGASLILCRIGIHHTASTAHFILYPSYDTAFEAMRVDALSSTHNNVAHGIMPLDSTGGLFHLVTDTVEYALLEIIGYAI